MAVERPLADITTDLHNLLKTLRTQEAMSLASAIEAGKLLLLVQDMKEVASMRKWLESALPELSLASARNYMRYATFEREIAEEGCQSQSQAHRFCRARGYVRNPGRAKAGTPEMREQARKLAAEGMKPAAVAKILGVTDATAASWMDEKAREKRNAVERANKSKVRAEQRAERAIVERRFVERAGPGMIEAYDLLKMVTDVIGGLTADPIPEVRIVAGPAHRSLKRATEQLARAAVVKVGAEA